MTLTIVLAVVLFFGLLLVFLVMLPRTTAESALLQEVARPTYRYQREEALPAWRSAVSADLLAKPFTFFRKFFTAEPDPALVRRLLLAGYRKPAHADIFLGARLALPVVFGFAAAVIFSSNIIFFFIMASRNGRPKACSSCMARNSLPTGSPTSLPTISRTAVTACPARRPRAIRSTASGSRASNRTNLISRLTYR